MKKTPYKRKPGDFEIRILKNGKVVMVAPDEKLVEIAQSVDPKHCATQHKTEAKENVRSQTSQAE
ncbi:MAG: hypothetical protein ACYSSO_11940 [Planctomycetota bacterium]|jgi:hypothetical protein